MEMGLESACLVMVGQLKGTATGLVNLHVKEGNMMDLDHKLFPSTASFNIITYVIQ